MSLARRQSVVSVSGDEVEQPEDRVVVVVARDWRRRAGETPESPRSVARRARLHRDISLPSQRPVRLADPHRPRREREAIDVSTEIARSITRQRHGSDTVVFGVAVVVIDVGIEAATTILRSIDIEVRIWI